MSARCFRIAPNDNVATLLDSVVAGPVHLVGAGAVAGELIARETINHGHKIALADLPVGAPVLKFGTRIGHASQAIARGDWVHLHNLASDLDERSARLDLHTGVSTDNKSAYA